MKRKLSIFETSALSTKKTKAEGEESKVEKNNLDVKPKSLSGSKIIKNELKAEEDSLPPHRLKRSPGYIQWLNIYQSETASQVEAGSQSETEVEDESDSESTSTSTSTLSPTLSTRSSP